MNSTREANVEKIPFSDPVSGKRSKVLDSTTGVVVASRSIKPSRGKATIKRILKSALNVGLVLTIGLTELSRTTAADSPERKLAITIHMHNYAGIAPKALAETEEVATEIFRDAGVETRWVDITVAGRYNQANSVHHPAFTSADIQLSILPRVMSDRLGIPNNVIGLAPDTDAQIVYVFESNVDAVFWRLLRARQNGHMERPVSRAQILGHVIAHELGHLLLNLKGHSPHGIMRDEMDFTDRHDSLLFSPQQAEVLRADVRRRNEQQQMLVHGD